MKKQSNTPKIRFQNYEDKWDIEKLINIFGTIRNAFVGTATPYYVEEGKFYLESNNVKNGKINYNSQIFINDEFYEKQRDKWLKTNDIVMVQSGHVGHTAVIPEELNNTAAHALIVFTDYKKEVNPHFLNYQFQSNGKRKDLALISTGNTIKHILASEMKNFKMDFPTFEEQSAIGSLFRTLDDLLSSYKDNLTNYQSLKATMLSKMFPKAGQTIPEIRLDGFERKWEKKKLIDLVSPVSRKVKKPSDPYYRLSIRSHAKGTFKQFVDDPKKIAMDNLFEVKENDLVVNITFAWEHAIAVASKEDDGLLVSHRFPTFVIDKSDKNFINIYIKREEFRQKLDLLSPGGAGRNRVLNVKDFIKIQMIVPELEEQQAIGSYFSNLDNFINSCQEKITQLETLKKKLLQDMFI